MVLELVYLALVIAGSLALSALFPDLPGYWLPVVLLVPPFVAGIRPVPPDAIGLLVVAYVATAVFEEGFWRGLVLGVRRPTGLWRAVLMSSLLFGLGHLGNSALRGISPLIAAQAFGAGVQGVGFAALRLRTNTIWLLVVPDERTWWPPSIGDNQRRHPHVSVVAITTVTGGDMLVDTVAVHRSLRVAPRVGRRRRRGSAALAHVAGSARGTRRAASRR